MRKIFSSLFICFAGFAYGQKAQPDSYTVYINYSAYSVRAEVLSAPLKFNAIKELDYYWYASNKIFHTQGGCDGKILNGQYASFYLSNSLKEKGNFKKGLRNGEWISWFENGAISEVSSWKNGLRQGVMITYDEKGNQLSEADYKNGKLNGWQKTYENGELKTEKRFKRGKEIIKAPKKEALKKEETSTKKEHPLQKKWNALFHRADKKDPAKKNSTPSEKKKTLFSKETEKVSSPEKQVKKKKEGGEH